LAGPADSVSTKILSLGRVDVGGEVRRALVEGSAKILEGGEQCLARLLGVLGRFRAGRDRLLSRSGCPARARAGRTDGPRPGTKHRVGAAAEIAFQSPSGGLYRQERVTQSHESSVDLRLLGRKRCARVGSNDLLGVSCGTQEQQGEEEGFTGHDSIPTSI